MYSDSESSDDEKDFDIAAGGNSDWTLARRYSENDLFPVKKDPSCEPDWPLAAYWPVFVGNFRAESWNKQVYTAQISNYFAYRGFLTRMMIFPRSDSAEFEEYHRNCLLLDFLVYFTSEEDADRAVATCHNDSYYGYRLNVLPGRTPLFYDLPRTIRFEHVGSDRVQEQNIGRLLPKYGGSIDFIARYPVDDVLVEFTSIRGMLTALQNQMRWRPRELTEPMVKQRFLEKDVISDIRRAMEENPDGFMGMLPKESVLAQLYEGVCPTVSTIWLGYKGYLKTPFLKKRKYYGKGKRAKKLAGARPKKGPWEAQNVVLVNKILAKHGWAPVRREEILAHQKELQRAYLQNLRKERNEKLGIPEKRRIRVGRGRARVYINQKVPSNAKLSKKANIKKGSKGGRGGQAHMKQEAKSYTREFKYTETSEPPKSISQESNKPEVKTFDREFGNVQIKIEGESSRCQINERPQYDPNYRDHGTFQIKLEGESSNRQVNDRSTGNTYNRKFETVQNKTEDENNGRGAYGLESYRFDSKNGTFQIKREGEGSQRQMSVRSETNYHGSEHGTFQMKREGESSQRQVSNGSERNYYGREHGTFQIKRKNGSSQRLTNNESERYRSNRPRSETKPYDRPPPGNRGNQRQYDEGPSVFRPDRGSMGRSQQHYAEKFCDYCIMVGHTTSQCFKRNGNSRGRRY